MAQDLRVSELVGLTLYSVDEEGIRVMGKGSKERVVPIGENGIESLDRYLATQRGRGKRDPLFLNKKGKPVDRIDVWHVIKKYSKQCRPSNRLSLLIRCATPTQPIC